MKYKLGRVAGYRHPRLPRMAAFLRTVYLPQLQTAQNWYGSVASFGMLLNDQIGDCTIASAGHMIQQESVYADTPALIMADPEALAGYEAVSGYQPGKPETDVGAYEGDVGKHWLTTGFQCGGQLDKIVGFADLNPQNLDELKYSILLTGNALLGFRLPACAEEESEWDLPKTKADGTIVGGHAVPAVGWDASCLYVVSWGKIIPVTWAFYKAYVDEAHTTLSHRWMNSSGTSPAGFDWSWLVGASQSFCALS